VSRSPWRFSSDGSGRFDLPPESGFGTCYLAFDPLGCFVEVFRSTALVPAIEIEVRRISQIELPSARLADAASRRSRGFGLTAEIHSSADYRFTQSWAAALWQAGFDGIHYLLRHDPSQKLAGVALFARVGSEPGAIVSTEPISAGVLERAERLFGIRSLPLP
jgi:hypothetical protein